MGAAAKLAKLKGANKLAEADGTPGKDNLAGGFHDQAAANKIVDEVGVKAPHPEPTAADWVKPEGVDASHEGRVRDGDVGSDKKRLVLNADRPTSIVARNPVDISAQRRLNDIDMDRNAYAPGEAGAAAEMENYLGGTLERAPGGTSADFIVKTGDFSGARIDFKLTPDTFDQAAKINTYFDKTFPKFSKSFADKLAKTDGVDLMPFDTRFLTEQNRQRLFDFVNTLPASSQQKVIYLVQ